MANTQPNTPSPSKRARISHHADDKIAFFDLNKTPVRPPQISATAGSSTRSASSFPTTLTSRLAFSAQPSSKTSHSDAAPHSRSTSPTKRFQTTESLLGLAVPIQFIKKQTLIATMPNNVRPLLKALSAVEAREALLPASNETQPASAAAAKYAAALHNHKQLRRIVGKSIASANKHRSEAG
ncbi:hypothetical protein NHJ13734_004478 [Beauveria thailandica]